jgi:hypothetical protein
MTDLPKNPPLSSYLKSFKAIIALAVGIGSLIPMVSEWERLTPPYIVPVPSLGLALAAACLLAIHHHRFPAETAGTGMPNLIKRGLRCLVAATVLVIAYMVLLGFTTSKDPQEGKRYQIGFGKQGWSLTEFARKHKDPTDSVETWILQCGCYREDGPQEIWTLPSIIAAGVLLAALFLGTLVLWTAGWGLIAKHHALAEPVPDK